MAKLCIRYEDQYVHLQKKYHHDMQLISSWYAINIIN